MSGDIDVNAILKRAADKSGFVRSRVPTHGMPISMSDVCVMWFFGDVRSLCILSSMLLRRYREQLKGSKYFILCTWPGYESMFPYVDEYWSVKDESLLALHREAFEFANESSQAVSHVRQLHYFFEDVVGPTALESFYQRGIQQAFWDKFKHVKVFLPSISSVSIMGHGFLQELTSKTQPKILLHPTRNVQQWIHGHVEWLATDKRFWMELVNRLLNEGFMPVIYQNFSTHDISQDVLGRCLCVAEKDINKVLALMRSVDCVLDVFSGISRLAIAARSPFVYCDERARYVGLKEYEVDGLCCEKSLPREYIFNFATIIKAGNEYLWNVNLFDNIIAKCRALVRDTDRDRLPSTVEFNKIMPYADVKKRKVQRIGTKFIKIERD